MRPRLALTTGEPAGIGPEIALAALDPPLPADITLIGDSACLPSGPSWPGRKAPIRLRSSTYRSRRRVAARPPRCAQRAATCWRPSMSRSTDAARVASTRSSPRRCRRASSTTPALPFSGHTEYLAERTGTPQVVMMLAGATAARAAARSARHHAPAARARQRRADDRCIGRDPAHPRSRSAPSLRPGASAHCSGRPQSACRRGRSPGARGNRRHRAGDRARSREGHRCRGVRCRPTRCFVPAHLQHYDAVLAMFHDQGLPVLKYATFGHGVNITLGLPFVRTSVDHGTALDLAGTGRAHAGSLRAALELAIELVGRQRLNVPLRRSAVPPALAMSEPGRPQHRARKRFGQNFLHDPRVIERIVDAIDPQPGQTIVEIGPGQAALTRALVERAGHITAIEIDRDLAAWLRSEFTPQQLTLIEADALEVRLVQPAGPAAHRRKPALQHLVAAAVRAGADRRTRGRPALHAAEGSRRSHGRRPGQPHLRPAVGDAAVPLPPDEALRRSARRLQSAAEGDIEHRAHAAAADRRAAPDRSCRLRSRGRCRLRSASQDPAQRPRRADGRRGHIRAGVDPQARAEVLSVADFVRLSCAFAGARSAPVTDATG